MAELPPPPTLSEETQHAHEALQRAILARGGRYQIPNPYPDGWRVGPVGLDSGPDEGAQLWLIAPWDPGESEPPLATFGKVATSLTPEHRARVTVALTCRELPPESVLAAAERALEADVVACTAREAAAGPQARARGSLARLEELLQVDNAALSAVDPAKAWTGLTHAVEGMGFFQLLRQVTPRAWVTPALITACVAVWLVQVLSGISPGSPSPFALRQWGANSASLTLHGEPWRLLTAGFLHGGIIHLGINMWILRDLGQLCERLFGNLAFLAVYLFAVVGGGLASMVWHPETVASVGASGGIFGLGGAILGFMAVQRNAIPGSVFARFKRSLGAFVVYNLIFGFAINTTHLVSVDNSAHIGGLVAGALAGAALARPLPPPPGNKRLLWTPALALVLGGVFVALTHTPSLTHRARLAGVLWRVVELDEQETLPEGEQLATLQRELAAVEAPPDRVELHEALATYLESVAALNEAIAQGGEAAFQAAVARRNATGERLLAAIEEAF